MWTKFWVLYQKQQYFPESSKLASHFWFFDFLIPFYVGSESKSGSGTVMRSGSAKEKSYVSCGFVPVPVPQNLRLVCLPYQSWNSGIAFWVEVSGHKLESSKTRVFVWFSTLVFHSTKCYSWIGLSFLSLVSWIFFMDTKNQSRVWFSVKSVGRRDCVQCVGYRYSMAKDSSLLLNWSPRKNSISDAR